MLRTSREGRSSGLVRIGTGPRPVATPLVGPSSPPVGEPEPMCAAALRQLVAAYATVADLPVTLPLRDHAHVLVRGPVAVSRALVRALLAQAATFHAPDDLRIALCVDEDRRAYREWAKWLPHAWHPTARDAAACACCIERREPRETVLRFLEPRVHRTHQHTVRKRREAEVERREQVGVLRHRPRFYAAVRNVIE